MRTRPQMLLGLAAILLAALVMLLLILPVLAAGGDYGLSTGATPGGPTPHLSVYEPTATPER